MKSFCRYKTLDAPYNIFNSYHNFLVHYSVHGIKIKFRKTAIQKNKNTFLFFARYLNVRNEIMIISAKQSIGNDVTLCSFVLLAFVSVLEGKFCENDFLNFFFALKISGLYYKIV